MDFRSAAGWIKDRTTLSDLVRETTGDEGRHRGADSYWFLCPFHREKTGSFHVRNNDGMYKCFGCGEAGDAIDFVSLTMGIGKLEAMELLYDKAGHELKLDDDNRDHTEHRTRKGARDVLHDVAGSCAARLFSSSANKTVKDYVDKLGLESGTVMKFGIGDFDTGMMPTIDKDVHDTIEPLISPLKPSRMVIPIRDASSRTIAFASRSLDGTEPKYLNSHNVEGIYEKSKTLYGLDVARKKALAEREMYFVEGYTDVWGLHDKGIENVVAVCSARLHEDQAKSVSRIIDTGVIIPDSDTAGAQGAVHSMIALAKAGIVPEVVVLPVAKGQDPYDFSRLYSTAEMHEIVRKSGRVNFVRWVLSGAEKGNIASMTEAMRSIGAIIKAMKDPMMREASIMQWRDETDMPHSVLRTIIESRRT